MLTATPPTIEPGIGLFVRIRQPAVSVNLPLNVLATGALTISGTRRVGETLMLDGPSLSTIEDPNGVPSPLEPSYQWQRSSTSDFEAPPENIVGANAPTYRLTDDDSGKHIRVLVSFTDSHGSSESIPSQQTTITDTDLCTRTQLVQEAILSKIASTDSCEDATKALLAGITGVLDLSNTGLGSLRVGDLTGLSGVTRLAIGGDQATDNDTADSNELGILRSGVFNDLSAVITLVIRNLRNLTTIESGAFSGLTSVKILAMSGNGITNAGLPDDVFMPLAETLTRLDLQNNALTAFPTAALSALPKLVTFRIEGESNVGVGRAGGNPGATFTIPYELKRTDDSTNNVATIQVQLPLYVPSTLRGIQATLSVTGGTLTVGSGAPETDPITVSLNTNVIVTATGSSAAEISATPPPNQSAVGGMQIVEAAPLVAVRERPVMGVPTISGDPAPRQTLTADITAIADVDGLPDTNLFSYQWQQSESEAFDSTSSISNAVNKDYQLADADAGKYIRVIVSFTDVAGNPEAVISEPILIAKTDLCVRTEQVRDAILAKITATNECADVTPEQLSLITGLDLSNSEPEPLTSLKAGDFAGLSGITRLDIGGAGGVAASETNSLRTLPLGVFDGLSSVTVLIIRNVGLETIMPGAFNGLPKLSVLSLSGNNISNSQTTPLPDDIFRHLNDPTTSTLTRLDLDSNNLNIFPANALRGLTKLGTGGIGGYLNVSNNPGANFAIPYELTRDSGTGSPATIRVRLPNYVSATQRNRMPTLSITGGTLTVGSDTPTTDPVTVALNMPVVVTAAGNAEVQVSVAPATSNGAIRGTVLGGTNLVVVEAGAAMGVPTISGTPTVGQTLIAGTDDITDDVDGLMAFSYQWQRSANAAFDNPSDISSAVNKDYELADDDAGKYVRVKVSFTDGANNPETVVSVPFAVPATTLCDRTPQVRDAILRKISGVDDCVVVTAERLSLITGILNLSNRLATPSSSLQAGDFAGLSGLQRLDIGGAGGVSASETNNLRTLPSGLFDDLSSVTELIIRNVGLETIMPGAFNGLPKLNILVLSGNNISNSQTAPLPDGIFRHLNDPMTSTLTRLDLDSNNLSVFPTNALRGLTKLGTGGSFGYLEISNNPKTGPQPFTIPYELVRTNVGSNGPATLQVQLPLYVSTTLRAMKATLSVTDGTLTVGSDAPTAGPVQVALNTDVIVTATGTSEVVVSATVPAGQTAVRGILIGDANELTLSVNAPATGAPTISRDPTMEQTLIADVTAIQDINNLPNNFGDPSTIAYQWQHDVVPAFSNPRNISGANSKTYTLTDSNGGRYIRVLVSFMDAAGNGEALPSVALPVPATDLCDRAPQVRDAIMRRLTVDRSPADSANPPQPNDCVRIPLDQLEGLFGTLNIGSSGTRPLQASDFADLKSVSRLDIGGAGTLTTLPRDMFADMERVRTLTIRNIRSFTTIESGAFNGLELLRTLTLSGNGLNHSLDDNQLLPDDVFEPIASTLFWLHLQDNNLKDFPTEALSVLPNLGGIFTSFVNQPRGIFNIQDNPRVDPQPFVIPYELVVPLTSPSSVVVRLPLYLSATLRGRMVSLSITEGSGTLTVGSDAPTTDTVMVPLDTPVTVRRTTGSQAVVVSATPSTVTPTTIRGITVGASSLEVVRARALTGVPTISGTPAPGQILVAGIDDLADVDGLPDTSLFSYQWQRSANATFSSLRDISGATSKTYTLTPDDASMYVRVVVSFTDRAAENEAVASAPTEISATDLCSRTSQVRTVLLDLIGLDDCVVATTAQLNAITANIDISNTGLTSLQAGDFADLTGITSISIAGGDENAPSENNTLTTLPEGLFPRLYNLRTLIIRNISTLSSIELRAFDGLTRLTTLVLSGNNLATDSLLTEPTHLLRPMANSLRRLDLQNNNMTSFPTEALSILPKLGTGGSFDLLSIQDNPKTNPQTFTIPYELVRTDSGTGNPATIRVRLPAYMPAEQRGLLATLSVTNGTGTLQVGSEAAESTVNVALDTDVTVMAIGDLAVEVSATPPPDHVAVRGMQIGPAEQLRVVDENIPATGTPPTISGGTMVLQVLTATIDTNSIADANGLPDFLDPLSLTYQWQRSTDSSAAFTNPIDISGANSNTYTLTDDDAGKYIRVVVSFTDMRGTEERLVSVATAQIVALPNSPATGAPPTISGGTMVPQVLTAAIDTNSIADDDGLPDPLTFTYQWQRSTDSSTAFTNPTNIGTSSNTYTLTDDDAGKYIRVLVSFSDGKGTTETLASLATAAIGAAVFTSKMMSAVGAVADLSTATVFTQAVATHLGAPAVGLRIDGQPVGKRLRSILQAVVPAGNQCLREELDPHERLQYGISGSSLTTSPCDSLDSDDMMRRLRSAAQVGDLSFALGGELSGIDLWLHATSFEVSGTPFIDGSQLDYDGGGLLAYIGMALSATDKIKYGFALGLSDTSLDLALVSGGSRNDTVTRNLLFGSGFIDYRLGAQADYRLRAVLGLGSGDADFTVINDSNSQTVSGSSGADLAFFTLNFSKEFRVGERVLLVTSVALANSKGSTDPVTLTGEGADVLVARGNSSATEIQLGMDTELSLGNNHKLTIGSALHRGDGDLGNTEGVDLITRYQSGRFNVQIRQQIVGNKNERNSYSLEYVMVKPKVKRRNRFGLTLGTDYNRSSSYDERLGELRDGPLTLGYFGRFSYSFGKENVAGSGSLGTRLRLNQDGAASTDLNLNIRF